MQHLYTPWRMAYITGEKKPLEGDCVFCNRRDSMASDHETLVVARSAYVYVVLNLYPYNNGHVMVVPYEHVGSQEDLPIEALTDLMATVNRAMAVLRRLYHPTAFNLGANIGAAAGAGIASHYHFHIVPRWGGDANFMSVVGETRIIPDTLATTHQAMVSLWQELFGAEG